LLWFISCPNQEGWKRTSQRSQSRVPTSNQGGKKFHCCARFAPNRSEMTQPVKLSERGAGRLRKRRLPLSGARTCVRRASIRKERQRRSRVCECVVPLDIFLWPAGWKGKQFLPAARIGSARGGAKWVLACSAQPFAQRRVNGTESSQRIYLSTARRCSPSTFLAVHTKRACNIFCRTNNALCDNHNFKTIPFSCAEIWRVHCKRTMALVRKLNSLRVWLDFVPRLYKHAIFCINC